MSTPDICELNFNKDLPVSNLSGSSSFFIEKQYNYIINLTDYCLASSVNCICAMKDRETDI
jgi:hypothetical protein